MTGDEESASVPGPRCWIEKRSRRGLGSTRHKVGHMGKGGAAFTQPQREVPFQSVHHMGLGTEALSSSPVT